MFLHQPLLHPALLHLIFILPLLNLILSSLEITLTLQAHQFHQAAAIAPLTHRQSLHRFQLLTKTKPLDPDPLPLSRVYLVNGDARIPPTMAAPMQRKGPCEIEGGRLPKPRQKNSSPFQVSWDPNFVPHSASCEATTASIFSSFKRGKCGRKGFSHQK